MLQKGCECRKREMEKWKQNWDEVFMDEVEREREMREKGEREKKIKCHKMFREKRMKGLIHLVEFLCLKNKK
jgi:hypothetical protein